MGDRAYRLCSIGLLIAVLLLQIGLLFRPPPNITPLSSRFEYQAYNLPSVGLNGELDKLAEDDFEPVAIANSDVDGEFVVLIRKPKSESWAKDHSR